MVRFYGDGVRGLCVPGCDGSGGKLVLVRPGSIPSTASCRMLMITGISVVRGSAGVGGWQPSHEAVGIGWRHAICAHPRTPTTYLMKERPYRKYLLMLGISFLVMYSVMFLGFNS